MRFEDVGGSEHDMWTRRDKFAPEFAARVFNWDGHQAEGAAERIGANEESTAALCVGSRVMIDVVFVCIVASGDDAECAGGLIGAEIVDFARRVAGGREQEIGTAARALDVY